MTTLLLEHLKDLQTNLLSPNPIEIIEKCNAIISTTTSSTPETKTLQKEIYSIQYKSMFLLKQYEEVLSSIRNLKKKGHSFVVEEVYAYYKLKRFDVCKEICIAVLSSENVIAMEKDRITNIRMKEEELGINNRIILHILGQCSYKLFHMENALKIYTYLWNNRQMDQTVSYLEEKSEIFTNVLACNLSSHHPLCPSDNIQEMYDSITTNEMDSDDYDLEYNSGLYYILTSSNELDRQKGVGFLQKSYGHCKECVQEEEEDLSELYPIQCNLAYIKACQGDKEALSMFHDILSKENVPRHVQTIAQHNVSLLEKKLPTEVKDWSLVLPIMQLRLMLLNTLAYCNNKQSSNTEKMSKNTMSKLRKLYRKYSTNPVLAHALQVELDAIDKKHTTLKDDVHPYTAAFPILQKAQMQLNQYKDLEDVLNTLEGLPTSIKEQVGYISTIISLYKYYNHDLDKILSYLETTSVSQDTISKLKADLYFSNGDYNTASELYEALYEQTKQEDVLANLIICYSFINVEKAEENVGLLPVVEEGEWDLSGEQLENLGIPTGYKRRVVRPDTKNDSTKLSRKQALNKKKRQRKREKYLKKLQEEGKYNPDKPTTPDPDRWLPKYMRGRKNRYSRNLSSQGTGTVSSRDMKKLDVAARVANKEKGKSGASTAHIQISKSDAGKRKGKGGRRR